MHPPASRCDAVRRQLRDRPQAAVLGAGLLGLCCSLFLADAGFSVTLIDQRSGVMRGASGSGEGKVHLGPVYALGDVATHRLMMRGAIDFAPLLERATGRTIDWDEVASEAFDYVVMPDSMVDPDVLRSAYRRINEAWDDTVRSRGHSYLGAPTRSVVDTRPVTHEITGLPAFRTTERAVDLGQLVPLLERALLSHDRACLRLGTHVHAVDSASGIVQMHGPDDDRDQVQFDVVVNCAWEGRSRIEASAGRQVRTHESVRVKAAARVAPTGPARPVTLVQGPYGDVVRHRDHTYLSWYPAARVHYEESRLPSVDALAKRDAAECDEALAHAQIRALAEWGLVDERAVVLAPLAGFVLAEGMRDIDQIDSSLHRRSVFGVRRTGVMLTPRNYKLTTAPLAAREAAEAARLMVGRA